MGGATAGRISRHAISHGSTTDCSWNAACRSLAKWAIDRASAVCTHWRSSPLSICTPSDGSFSMSVLISAMIPSDCDCCSAYLWGALGAHMGYSGYSHGVLYSKYPHCDCGSAWTAHGRLARL